MARIIAWVLFAACISVPVQADEVEANIGSGGDIACFAGPGPTPCSGIYNPPLGLGIDSLDFMLIPTSTGVGGTVFFEGIVGDDPSGPLVTLWRATVLQQVDTIDPNQPLGNGQFRGVHLDLLKITFVDPALGSGGGQVGGYASFLWEDEFCENFCSTTETLDLSDTNLFPTPEPTSGLLFPLGLTALSLIRRKVFRHP